MNITNQKSGQILILWDNVTQRNNLSTFFRLHGFSVDISADGFQGLSMIENQLPEPFNIILVGDDLSSLPPEDVLVMLNSQFKVEEKPCIIKIFHDQKVENEALNELKQLGVDMVLTGTINLNTLLKFVNEKADEHKKKLKLLRQK
jgi:hypothetical protein